MQGEYLFISWAKTILDTKEKILEVNSASFSAIEQLCNFHFHLPTE